MHTITLATNGQTNTAGDGNKKSQMVRKRVSETLCLKLCKPSPVNVTGNRGRGDRKQTNKIKTQRKKVQKETNSTHTSDKVGFEGQKMH